MTRKICAIDGNSLMHRAFHAINAPMTAPDGTPTNAIFGFLNMFFKYVSELTPDVTICAFDCGKATHRLEIYEKYKESRPSMDDRLRVQFPIIQELLGAMGVPVVQKEGWEGDDVLGTIARRASSLDFDCYLVTGDKDMNQLVNDKVFTVTSDKNREVIIRDVSAIKEKFGVYPNQIIDYLAFVGDSSDDIPGIPSIGAKSAASMLEKYETMDGVYDNLSDFKGKKLENLIEYKDQGYLSRQLATINVNLDFDLDLNVVESFVYDEEILEETFLRYGLRSPLANFRSTLQRLKGEQTTSENITVSYPPRSSAEDIISTIDQDSMIGLSIVYPTKKYIRANEDAKEMAAISDGERTCVLDIAELRELLPTIIKCATLVGYDIKDFLNLVWPHNNDIACLISGDELKSVRLFDTHVASNMVDSHLTFKRQEEFFSLYDEDGFDVDDDVEERAGRFAYLNLVAKKKLEDSIVSQGQHVANLYELTEIPLVSVLAKIERNGVLLDCEKLEELGRHCDGELNRLTKQIFEEAGREFSIDSPMQLGSVMFEEMGIPPVKKNKSGYSTDSSVLSQLADEHAIARYVMSYRELAKLKSTYIDALPLIRETDGLVHTCFNQAATATGRLSSSDPNLQNIPVRTEFGKHIREAFLPLSLDHVFMSADYSQIELRLLAHLSGDENLIDAFCSGRDFHAQTASRIFNCDESEVTPQMRSSAKAINFGIVYGQQAFTLSRDLSISFAQAKGMIDRYYESYPKVKSFLDSTVEKATARGYAETLFGRRRSIPELQSPNRQLQGFGERTAKNHPMQGTAADIIKKAMIELDSELDVQGFSSKILLQVHDELDLSVPREEIDDVSALLKKVMENVVNLKVPLIVEVSFGDNWAMAH